MSRGALILGQAIDPHVAKVAQALRELGLDVAVFDQYRDQAAITFDPASRVVEWPFDAWVAGHDGVVVWNRVKFPVQPVREEFMGLLPGPNDPVGPYQTKEFYRSEWRAFTYGLQRRLLRFPHVRLVNLGETTAGAHCKPWQLQVAMECGFRIPHTVVGNAEAVVDARFGEEVLYKSLTPASVGGRGFVPPAVLPKADVLAEGRTTVAPSIFQERVAKLRELRVHVAGPRIRVLEIDSQSVEYGRLDWRVAQNRAEIFRWTPTPPALAETILRYMAALQLDIGAFDFAVDPDGQWIFFECNPGGQFNWLEEFTGAPICHDIAELLADLASRASVGARPVAAE